MTTKKLISTALIAFMTAFSFIVLYGCWQKNKSAKETVSTSTTGESKEALFSSSEIEKHNHATDCWMVIRGTVYDLSDYIKQHPTAPELITPYCGKEATEAYATKGGRGRAHSPHADQLLRQYRIGKLQGANSSQSTLPP